MRDHYERRRTSVLTWLFSSIVAMFVLQNLATRLLGMGYWLEITFGLSANALRAGHVWTLLTYGFLHDTGNLLQILSYLLTLYFIGGEVLSILGTRRFIGFYLSALAAGGAFWMAVHWRFSGLHPEVLLGASGAVWGLITLYACFFPNREISQLLFFVLPIRLKPKYLAYGLLAIDLFGLVFYEILGSPSPLGAAHSAHPVSYTHLHPRVLPEYHRIDAHPRRRRGPVPADRVDRLEHHRLPRKIEVKPVRPLDSVD